MADWTAGTNGGLIPPGRVGKALKLLVTRESWEKVRPAWQHYLKVTTIQYASPERFAATYGEWVIKPKAQPIPRVFREVLDGQRLRLVEE